MHTCSLLNEFAYDGMYTYQHIYICLDREID